MPDRVEAPNLYWHAVEARPGGLVDILFTLESCTEGHAVKVSNAIGAHDRRTAPATTRSQTSVRTLINA